METTAGATTWYVRGPSGGLIYEHTPGGDFYYVADGQGSVIALVEPTGVQRAAYTYDPYGDNATVTPMNGALPANPWRWEASYLDSTTGLYKLGARYYDPHLGRFTQVDPVEGGSCNGYDYVCGDPVNGFDLDGRAVEGECVSGQFSVSWVTFEGSICTLRDDRGNKLVTYSGGIGGGATAGVSSGGYTSNAPTVYDVLGPSICLTVAKSFGSGEACAFRGRDGHLYHSEFFGLGPRSPLSGAITLTTTKKAPRFLRGTFEGFVRNATGYMGQPS